MEYRPLQSSFVFFKVNIIESIVCIYKSIKSHRSKMVGLYRVLLVVGRAVNEPNEHEQGLVYVRSFKLAEQQTNMNR